MDEFTESNPRLFWFSFQHEFALIAAILERHIMDQRVMLPTNGYGRAVQSTIRPRHNVVFVKPLRSIAAGHAAFISHTGRL